MNVNCHISGLGISVPETTLTNQDLEKIMDTSDEWIVTRTGIKNRHIVKENENISDYAFLAAVKAIDDAKISPSQITHVLTATVLYYCPKTGAFKLFRPAAYF